MGKVISFEDRAVANLRARVAAVEEANQDLIAFARGHSGAVTSIHEAVLAAIECDDVETLLHVVTQEWPLILGIDAVALSLIIGDQGFRADGSGVQKVDAVLLRRTMAGVIGVEMRAVERGHPLFGPACPLIRAEALIRIDCDPDLPIAQPGVDAPRLPCGLLALGQR